jgi:hypothetical protein
VDVHELETLVTWLSKKTGKAITVESLIVVSTDSAEVSNMLDSLRDAMKNGKTAAVQKVKRSKPAKPAKPANTDMGAASRLIEETGEVVSLRELKRRMALGEIKDQTVVINKRQERFVVFGNELIKEPQS